MINLIGIGGTNGSGKDSIGEMLAERHGWLFISVSQLLRDELTEQGLPTDRQHTRQLSAKWRRESGLGVLIDKAFETYNPKQEQYKGLVISSLRNPGEADEIHKLGGKVIWIDANSQVRYSRAKSRSHGRLDDQKSYKEFLAEEQHEMQHNGGHHTLSMEGVKSQADILIENNADKQSFFKNIEKSLNLT